MEDMAACTEVAMEDMAACTEEAMEDMAACTEVAMIAMDHTVKATAWDTEATVWATVVTVWATVVVIMVATVDLEDTVCGDHPSGFNYENQSSNPKLKIRYYVIKLYQRS